MFVVTCPMRDDRLALTLESVGQFKGFRRIGSSVAEDAVAALMTRLYGEPVPVPSPDPWVVRRYFAEDN